MKSIFPSTLKSEETPSIDGLEIYDVLLEAHHDDDPCYKLGKNVVQTQIISILNTIYGVFKVELETPKDIDIKEYQWANLINYDITIGGYADE